MNLSQELNTKLWDLLNSGCSFEDVEGLYCDIAKLDILSGIEIDKAKKEFAVDSVAEIKKLKKKYCEHDERGRQIKPNFFGKIARMKGYYDSEKKNYRFHDTSMDYLQHCLNGNRNPNYKSETIPFSDLLKPNESRQSVWYPQVNRILGLVRNMRDQVKAVWNSTDDGLDNEMKAIMTAEIKDECQQYIKAIHLNPNTAYRLLLAIEDPANKDISRSLFSMLFSIPNDNFVSLLEERREPLQGIVQTDAGIIEIYGRRYRKVPLLSTKTA